MDSQRLLFHIGVGLFSILCFILLVETGHSPAFEPKPKILEDFTSIQGGVLFGARVRYDVIDISLCDVSQLKDMNLTRFSKEILSAEINGDGGKGTIVTSQEEVVLDDGNGGTGFFHRQTRTSIHFDGSASLSITDLQPLTFKVMRKGELFCTWRNNTAYNMSRGVAVWQEQWQATEMGTMDRLQEAVKGGNLIYFYVNANQLTPAQYRSGWSSYVQDFSLMNDTFVFRSRFLHIDLLTLTEIAVKNDSSAIVTRYVINRATNACVTQYAMKGVVGYDTAVHFYWTGLF